MPMPVYQTAWRWNHFGDLSVPSHEKRFWFKVETREYDGRVRIIVFGRHLFLYEQGRSEYPASPTDIVRQPWRDAWANIKKFWVEAVIQ